MKKSYSFTILNFLILSIFTTIITVIRVIQLKFLTDFNIACDNFKTYYFFGISLDSKTLSGFMYFLIFFYMTFILFFVFKNRDDRFLHFYEIEKKASMQINISLILFFVLSLFCSFLFIKNFEITKSESQISLYLNIFSHILFSSYFLYMFLCFSKNKFDKKNFLNVIFIFPVLWNIVRMFGIILLSKFFILTSREIVISNFKIAFFTLFLFCFGRALIGANSKNNESYLIGFGFLSIFFGLISLIPRTIIYFSNFGTNNIFKNKIYEYNVNIFNGTNYILFDFIILFFIFIFLFTFMFRWKKI